MRTPERLNKTLMSQMPAAKQTTSASREFESPPLPNARVLSRRRCRLRSRRHLPLGSRISPSPKRKSPLTSQMPAAKQTTSASREFESPPLPNAGVRSRRRCRLRSSMQDNRR